VLIGFILIMCAARESQARVFVDALGRVVPLPESPQRIVSLAPSITETLFALGLDREIAGVTMFSDYPAAALTKPKVGSFINISLEKVVALNPDLVIATADGNKKELILQLEALGLAVYVVNPQSFEDIFAMVGNVGKITAREEAAHRLVADLELRVRQIVSLVQAAQKPRVFFQIGIDPIVSVGRETVHHTLIHMAGGVNITQNIHISYPNLSVEEIIDKKPDVIIVSSMKRGGDFINVLREWRKWKNIPAVTNNRIHIINSDVTDHSSPRIVDGLEALAKIIHPELFALR